MIHRHIPPGHLWAYIFGDAGFFLGMVTPICLSRRASRPMILSLVVANLAWLGFLAFARLRASLPSGKIGKVPAREYFYGGLTNYLLSGLLSCLLAWYIRRH